MKLSDLKPAPGSKRKSKRVGRGPGSGLGKTSGRGMNGAGQRKSSNVAPGFEGGQQPLQRRVPKRGFRSHFPRNTQIVNLRSLETKCDKDVTPEILEKIGLIQDASKPVKILGTGKLTKSLFVKANKFSATATKAIEAAGGKTEVI